MKITPIVEGYGEVAALPILLRRIALQLAPQISIQIHEPVRQDRGRLLQLQYLDRALALASKSGGAILLVVDSENTDAIALEDRLKAHVSALRSDLPIEVVVAHPMFEAWILASAASLTGTCGLTGPLEDLDHPEDVKSPKAWLQNRMEPGRKYRETDDMRKLVSRIDLEIAARHSPSFRRLISAVERILAGTRNEAL